MTQPEQTRLIVVDISSFIFRAFYAVRLLHSPDGTPINAVHGVLSMMLKLLSDYQPTHVVLARDTKGGSFRKELYPEYKANRSEPPEELKPQFDLIATLQEKMELPFIVIENYEADDVIGSIAIQWKDKFDEILIASGDKDLMQFVDGKVKMLDTMKGKIYGPDEVIEKMGVRPDQVVDYLSLIGDTSDNIPGMKGIGAKGAAKLLGEHETLEKCIEVKETFTNKRVKNAFENHVEDALLSKKLIEIVTDLDLTLDATETKFKFYPSKDLIDYLKGLGFKTAIKKLENMAYIQDQADGKAGDEPFSASSSTIDFDSIVVNPNTFDKTLAELDKESELAICPFFKDTEGFESLVGLSIAPSEKKSFYFPLGHQEGENLSTEQQSQIISTLLNSEERMIIGSHLKKFFAHLYFKKINFLCSQFDVTVAHYAVDVTAKHRLDFIGDKYFAFTLPEAPKKIEDFSSFSVEDASTLTQVRAILNMKLKPELEKDLKENELEKVFNDIDTPLVRVLAKMESQGICINANFFESLESEFNEELMKIISAIETESGVEGVNLNSPKQVSALLFENLGLPIIKKTKTGASTDVEVLTELDSRGLSPIPALILRHRELDKLLSTYIRVLPKLINPQSERLHTHLNQTVTATGRLSSDKPNLQNIPVRTEHGKRVRKGFMASPGNLLLAADYSQVELRLLAHFADDQTMIDAFNNDKDIHAQTASEVLDVPLEKVTSEERSKAKAVNFGLMYGQSSFGLAKALRISRGEAKDYITNYFERFHSVKDYLDGLKELAAERGYSETDYGRKRFLPDITSQNRTVRSNAERIAINSPIQGTASDIIKIAMINIAKRMKAEKLESRMILQVHDELIFDVIEKEIETMKVLVREEMEGAAKLKVPLKVDMGIGVNWYDLK